MDDAEFHERIIMLDRAALADWEARHRPAVVGWLVRGRVDPSDAEEIWNDAFAATVNAAPELTPRGISLRRYAFRVARNLRADRVARQVQRNEGSLGAEAERGNPYDVRPVPDQRRVGALKQCLEACPERYRMVVELAEEGRDVEELAAILEIDAGSVYQVRHRARSWLQACIDRVLE